MRKVLLATAALCAISASAVADEMLKYRVVMHITASQCVVIATIPPRLPLGPKIDSNC